MNAHSSLTLQLLLSLFAYFTSLSPFRCRRLNFKKNIFIWACSAQAFVLDEHTEMKWKTVKGAYHQLVSLSLSSSSSLPLFSLLLRSSFVYTCTSIRSVLIAENNRKIEQKENIYDHFAEPYQTMSREHTFDSTHYTLKYIHICTSILLLLPLLLLLGSANKNVDSSVCLNLSLPLSITFSITFHLFRPFPLSTSTVLLQWWADARIMPEKGCSVHTPYLSHT